MSRPTEILDPVSDLNLRSFRMYGYVDAFVARTYGRRLEAEPEDEEERSAVRKILDALPRGGWITAKSFAQVLRVHSFGRDRFTWLAPIAESDSGQYVCVLDETVPESAPDEGGPPALTFNAPADRQVSKRKPIDAERPVDPSEPLPAPPELRWIPGRGRGRRYDHEPIIAYLRLPPVSRASSELIASHIGVSPAFICGLRRKLRKDR